MRRALSASAAAVLALTAALAAGEKPEVPPHLKGPVGEPRRPLAKWGAVVRDEVNGEWLWFGGSGGRSTTGALGTWVCRDGEWRELPPEGTKALMATASLRRKARRLYAAVANRYYVSEAGKAAEIDLEDACAELARGLEEVAAGEDHARKLQADARSRLEALAPRLAGKISVSEVAAAREAMMALVRLEWELRPEPPGRCYPAMVFDAATKSVILFGGEGVWGAYNDTWIYDCKKRSWRRARSAAAPSPRCGAGIAAREGKVYLAGGFQPRGSMDYCAGLWFRMPVDVWEFDIRKETWRLIRAPEGKARGTSMQPRVELTLSEDGKKLSWKADIISYRKKKGEVTGSMTLPAADAGTAAAGVTSGTILVRGLGFDPAWYEDVPPADPDAVAGKLAELPANMWTDMAPPRRHVNRDWGTTVLDLRGDQLLHWAGGHSSHCGTDVAHYSIATNRWHILYAPELPFEYTYSNDGAPLPSMTGRPWGPHSYLSYAWDEVTGRMIWTGRHGAYARTNPGSVFSYDPAAYEWSFPEWTTEGGRFDRERHKTCMARTPKGLLVWGDKRGGTGGESGLWMADTKARVFRPVVATAKSDRTTLPFSVYGDRHGITYDSKRDRALIFHFGRKDKHRVWAVDLAAKAAKVHEPKNSGSFPATASEGREATYIPGADVVVICTRAKPAQKTLVYDCAADEWLEMPDPCAKDRRGRPVPAYGVSTGVEWDPKRGLLWLAQTNGAVYAMRFDRRTAGLEAPSAEGGQP